MTENEEKARALAAGETAPLEPVGLVDGSAGGAGQSADASPNEAAAGNSPGGGALADGMSANGGDGATDAGSSGEAARTGTVAMAADGGGGADPAAANDAASDASADADADATQVIDLGSDVDLDDPVVAKRIAHGLSPEPTDAKAGGAASGGGLDGLGEDAKFTRAFSKERREQKEAEDRLKKERHKKRMRIIRRTILLIVLLLLVAAAVALWWLRWGTVDDKAAIQGTWKIAGTDTTVTITDTQITLTDEVAYDYVIDPESKTIVYTFGGLTGQGRYRLSFDGDSLALSDGEYDWLSTLVSDIPWTIEAALADLKHNEPKSPDFGVGQLLERVEEPSPVQSLIGQTPDGSSGQAE